MDGVHDLTAVTRCRSSCTDVLQLVLLVPAHLRVCFWRARVVRAHRVEAAVTKLNSKSGEEGKEEHDQRPLASSCVHVEALSNQGEIENHAESDSSGQQEANDADDLSLVLQVNSQGDVGLQPAEEQPQSERHEGAKVVNIILSKQLEVSYERHSKAAEGEGHQTDEVQPWLDWGGSQLEESQDDNDDP